MRRRTQSLPSGRRSSKLERARWPRVGGDTQRLSRASGRCCETSVSSSTALLGLAAPADPAAAGLHQDGERWTTTATPGRRTSTPRRIGGHRYSRSPGSARLRSIPPTGRARSRTRAQHGTSSEMPIVPTPTEPVDVDSELRIVIEPGDLLCFSGAHLHASVPNTSGITRFSVELRTVNAEDVQGRRGAPNVDGEAPRVAWRWFKGIERLAGRAGRVADMNRGGRRSQR